MTLQEALERLDELVDNELPAERAGQLRALLQGSEAGRREYEITQLLTRSLKQERDTVPDPGPDYWDETTGLILARTVDAERTTADRPALATERAAQRMALWRSVASVMASLAILFAAVTIGLNQQRSPATFQGPETTFLATADVRDVLLMDEKPVYTVSEQRRLATGMLMIGTPSFIGRFAGLPELINPAF